MNVSCRKKFILRVVEPLFTISFGLVWNTQINPCNMLPQLPDLPDGQINEHYSEQIIARFAPGIPYWFIVSGTLPDGITLDPVTGTLHGTPTDPAAAGDYEFTVGFINT